MVTPGNYEDDQLAAWYQVIIEWLGSDLDRQSRLGISSCGAVDAPVGSGPTVGIRSWSDEVAEEIRAALAPIPVVVVLDDRPPYGHKDRPAR